MSLKKILTVLGARPQFIKAAAVSRAISVNGKIKESIYHSGQHYDANMSDIFFEQMEIPKPEFKLNISQKTHGKMTAEIMSSIEDIVLVNKFDAIMVYGDTNTTLAGALVGAKLHIPIIHIESGLRSFNKKMPEEINRITTDHVSQLLFCPTKTSVENLKNEGIVENVHLVGDVMFDAMLHYKAMMKEVSIPHDKPVVLLTIHRQENTDDIAKISEIFSSLNKLSSRYNIVFPVHPRTRKVLQDNNIDTSKIILLEPVGYFEMLYLISKSSFVMTDSGGLQKEAYFFQKPLLILREETEWVELVDNKLALIVGSSGTKIEKAISVFISSYQYKPNLYGDGSTASKIVDIIANF